MSNDAQSRPNHPGSSSRPATGPTGTRGTAHRHSWQRAGGGPGVAGAILLAVATWLEYLVLGPGVPGVVFVLFLVAFVASVALFAVAAFNLAHYGIVGTSSGGRFALRAYGTSWVISQGVYLTYRYFLPPAISNFDLVVLSTAFVVLTMIFGLVAAIFVALGRIAWGPARWSLFVAIAVAIIVGVVITSSDSLILLSVMETISALSQLFVALTYYLAPGRDPWISA